MMKKFLFLMFIGILISLFSETQAQTGSSMVNKQINIKEFKLKGEKIFIKNAEKCLDIMEQNAKANSVKGVAVIAFVPGNNTESLILKMRVIENLVSEKHNFFAVACSKTAEMITTYLDSGSGIRQPLNGETGYKGGKIRKVKFGYLVASFSGGPSEIDAKISQSGLDWLSKYY